MNDSLHVALFSWFYKKKSHKLQFCMYKRQIVLSVRLYVAYLCWGGGVSYFGSCKDGVVNLSTGCLWWVLWIIFIYTATVTVCRDSTLSC